MNDASCLIDLKKGRLLPVMLELPYRFVVPFPIRVNELLDFTELEWDMLEAGGLETYDLPSAQMVEVFALRRTNPQLSAYDCMCLVSTRHHADSILLTGDMQLRNTAKSEELRTHGVLWVVDELREKTDCDESLICQALEIWRDDQTVFLPQNEIQQRLK
ncbi:MAG: type II toxin-antitoxin system VapC family toxin [Pseudomonadota bacterium]